MATRPKHLTIKDGDIQRLEGKLQELADLEVQHRPKSLASDIVADTLGIRRRTLQEWVRKVRPASRNSETVARFLDVYDRIVNLMSEKQIATIHDMAKPDARDGFKAATWLLARNDPENYDPNYQAPEDEDDSTFSSANVPQEIFDALTDEEIAEIDAMAQARAELDERYKQLILRVEHRVRASELAERSAGSDT